MSHMKYLIITSLLILFGIAISCSEENNEHVTKWTSNPNGDSELALLMRDMFDDVMRMKMQIKDGKKPEVLKKFKDIHTADATEPEKAASNDYKAFANAYLAALENLEKAEPDETKLLYQGLVNTCSNCHQAMCPGPLVRIKKLNLPKDLLTQ